VRVSPQRWLESSLERGQAILAFLRGLGPRPAWFTIGRENELRRQREQERVAEGPALTTADESLDLAILGGLADPTDGVALHLEDIVNFLQKMERVAGRADGTV
jgi:hypothetical protein